MSKVYQEISNLLIAIENCKKSNNTEWLGNHTDKLYSIVKDCLPSGSGIDCGTAIDLDESTCEKLVFICDYHHMNSNGFYDGWTRHKIIVKASLSNNFDIRITGRDRNDIKEYLYECYYSALNAEFSR